MKKHYSDGASLAEMAEVKDATPPWDLSFGQSVAGGVMGGMIENPRARRRIVGRFGAASKGRKLSADEIAAVTERLRVEGRLIGHTGILLKSHQRVREQGRK